jgi:hypothetical protein
VLHWQHGAPSGTSRRIGSFKTDGARSRVVGSDTSCKLGAYTTTLRARIKIKETTDAIAVTRVSALNVP